MVLYCLLVHILYCLLVHILCFTLIYVVNSQHMFYKPAQTFILRRFLRQLVFNPNSYLASYPKIIFPSINYFHIVVLYPYVILFHIFIIFLFFVVYWEKSVPVPWSYGIKRIVLLDMTLFPFPACEDFSGNVLE